MGFNFSQFFRLLTTEPFVFLCCFNIAIRGSALTQLYQDKICINNFGYSREICQDLNNAKKEYLESVLKLTNSYKVYDNLLTMLPSLLLLFFCGSWVDKYRSAVRQILLLQPCLGIMNALLLILNTYYFHWPIWATLLSCLPLTIMGDICLPIMCIYGQAAKVTPEDMRSIRFTTLDLGVQVGMSVGSYIVGYVLLMTPLGPKAQIHNCMTIFLIALSMHIVAFVWTLLMVKTPKAVRKDSLDKPQAVHEGNWFHKLFDIQLLIRTLRISTKVRPNYGRLKIWLLLVCNSIEIANSMALPVFLFQYVQRTLGWDNRTYGYVNSVTTIGQTLAMISAVPLLTKGLKIRDATLGVIGATSAFFGAAIRGTFLTPVGFCSSYVVGALATVTPVAIKALLTPLVPGEELGSLYTFLIVTQQIGTVGFAPIFTSAFSFTIENYPGFVFHLSAFTILIPLTVFIGFRITAKNNPYIDLDDETSIESNANDMSVENKVNEGIQSENTRGVKIQDSPTETKANQ